MKRAAPSSWHDQESETGAYEGQGEGGRLPGEHASEIAPPVAKRARIDALAQALERAISNVGTLCERAMRGGSADDMTQLFRLVSGSALAAGAAGDPTMCAVLVDLYRSLWAALLLDREAHEVVVATTGQQQPPTVMDVASTYASIGTDVAPTTNARNALARQWTRSVGDDPRLARYLVHLVGESVRRVLPGRQEEGVVQVFGPEWAAVTMPDSPSLIGGCDPRRLYYILHAGTDQSDAALLFVIDPDRTVSLVDSAVLSPYQPRIDASPYYLDRVEADKWGAAQPVIPEGLRRFEYMEVHGSSVLNMFLACLAQSTPYDPIAEPPQYLDQRWIDALLFRPLPSGVQQVLNAMTEIDDEAGNPMPPLVHDFIENVLQSAPPRAPEPPRLYYGIEEPAVVGRPKLDFIDDAMEGLLLDECQLVAALHLFAGQVRARAAIPEMAPNAETVTLRDLALAAYRGPVASRLVPREILGPTALRAWATTCAEPASQSGLLPNADRLLDVASLWGVPTRNAHLARPELLCDALADVADARV